MFKARAALLGILALLIASGIAASTASAAGPYWHVNGSKLGQGVAKQVKLQSKGPTIFDIKILGGVITGEIVCQHSYSEGATIEGQGPFQGQDKGRLVFEQCISVFKPEAPECNVAEPIKFNQLKSYLAYNGTKPENKQQKFVDVFEPRQGEVLGAVHFHGKGCPFEEADFEEVFAAEIVPIEKDSKELLFYFSEAPITTIVHEQQERNIRLIFAAELAVLSGSFSARLQTGETWGVFGQ